MLSISHGPSGAFIASKIPNPLISVPLCIAIHFFEDAIPHWDVGQGMNKKTKSKKAAFIQELTWDFPLSIVIVYIFFQYGHSTIQYQAWLGWFAALLPDFLEFPYVFLGWRFRPISDLARLHAYFHRSTAKKLLGLAPQIITLGLIFLLR